MQFGWVQFAACIGFNVMLGVIFLIKWASALVPPTPLQRGWVRQHMGHKGSWMSMGLIYIHSFHEEMVVYPKYSFEER